MLKPKITIKTDTKHLTELKRRFKNADKAYVSVGVHEGAGEYADGTSVMNVALWNEFGTEHIPSRPFIRNAVYGHEGQINAWRKEAIGKIISGEFTVKQGLDMIGFRLQILIQKNITSNMPPPNAPATVAHKRAEGVAPPDQTLMETQLLLRSVTYKTVGV
jgi:hypothetical protein